MGDINSSLWVALLAAAVLNGVPLLFGTVGEILSEKAGNLNLRYSNKQKSKIN